MDHVKYPYKKDRFMNSREIYPVETWIICTCCDDRMSYVQSFALTPSENHVLVEYSPEFPHVLSSESWFSRNRRPVASWTGHNRRRFRDVRDSAKFHGIYKNAATRIESERKHFFRLFSECPQCLVSVAYYKIDFKVRDILSYNNITALIFI